MNSSEKNNIEQNGHSQARLILTGHWLYDNIVSKPIRIFAINYDYYFEMDKSDGISKIEDVPELNEKGEQYRIAWHGDNYFSWAGTTDYGGLTLEEAKEEAQKVVQQQIKWDEPVTKDYL